MAPFSVTTAGVLSATSANITGTVTATAGSIGGWQVDNAGKLIGSSSTGRITLNPSAPNIEYADSTGETKLNIKIGSLTDPESADNFSATINQVLVTEYGITTSGNSTTSGTTTSFSVPAAGTYVVTVKYNWGSSYIQYGTSPAFTGYLFLYSYVNVVDAAGVVYGTMYVNSADSFTGGDSGTVYSGLMSQFQSFTFPAAGTYYMKPVTEVMKLIQSGYIDYTIYQEPQGSKTFNKAVSLAEISDKGMIIADSANDYIKMNRVGDKIKLKGTVYFDSNGAGQFSYCNGVWHPFVGNTNDLGSTGNRWRTVWTNNALNISDERLKNSIEDSDLGLEFLNKLKPKKFKYNESKTPRYHYGFVAQEISSSLSEYGHGTDDVSFIHTSSLEYTDEQIEKFKTQSNWESVERDINYQKERYMGLNYTELIAPMIKAIQELNDKVIYLEAQLSGSI